MAATKQRYSDFIVREVDLKGQPVPLTLLPSAFLTAASDEPLDSKEVEAKAVAMLGEAQARQVLSLEALAADGQAGEELVLAQDDDKNHRREVHQLVKALFPHLMSDTVDAADGGKSVRITSQRAARQAAAAADRDRQRGGGGGGKRRRIDNREDWPAEAGGNHFLGFTLYKENKDTTEAISRLAKGLGVSSNIFQYAGTKDKRGVTTQRVNAFKLQPARLCRFMAKAPFGDAIVLGNLAYEDKPLRLGAHGGNRFTIVLRDVSCGEAELEAALSALQSVGFINYFGLQRFGNSADAATHKLGIALLRSDYHGCLDMILGPREGDRDAESDAARRLWAATKDAKATLEKMPRRMLIERQVLEGVIRHGHSNALQAIGRLPKRLQSMYLHAFQSYVFNHAATARVRRYGVERAVAGDLVWKGGDAPSIHEATTSVELARAGGDEGGAASSVAAVDVGVDGALVDDEMATAESGAGSAEFVPHVVTEEEATAATYSIEDVLLPMPGYKTILPENAVAEEITSLMEAEGVPKSSLHHRVKELALPGGYRKLIQRPQQMTWRVMRYDDPNLPLAPTDLTLMRGEPLPEGVPDGRFTAARLEFTLPSSTYATMCLRELTKQSTELQHQNALNARSGGAASTMAAGTAAAAVSTDGPPRVVPEDGAAGNGAPGD